MILWIITSILDPSDPHVLETRRKRLKLSETDLACLDYFDAVCKTCRSGVEITSKHCGECNRCVAGFDHHCKWLNNCIGGKNYREFLATIIVLEIHAVLSVTAYSFVINMISQEEDVSIDRLRAALGTEDVNSALAPVSIALIIALLMLIANTNLIAFHVYINVHNISTYDYIMASRALKGIIKRRTSAKVYQLPNGSALNGSEKASYFVDETNVGVGLGDGGKTRLASMKSGEGKVPSQEDSSALNLMPEVEPEEAS